jgi:2-haloalkanoic acid dehalogenase type II
MSKVNAVLFDAYNTLVHNEPSLWKGTFTAICRIYELPIDGEELWRQWKLLEVNFRKYRTNTDNPEASPPFKSYEKAWRECFKEVFDKLGSGNAQEASRLSIEGMATRELFPETIYVLDKLKDLTRVGILSNSDDSFLLPLVERYEIKGLEIILSSEQACAYKPHPRPFNIALQRLDLKPSEVLYVGDHPFDDVYGANKVGIRTVWVNREGVEYDNTFPKPDFIISNLMELEDIVN